MNPVPLAQGLLALGVTTILLGFGSTCRADDYIAPPSDLSEYGAESFLDNAKKLVDSTSNEKIKKNIIFDMILASSKAKKHEDEKLLYAMLLSEFPDSDEAKFILNLKGYISLAECFVDIFENQSKENHYPKNNVIFKACRNLFCHGAQTSGNAEFLALLLLSNEYFQDDKFKLPSNREATVPKKIIRAIQSIRKPGRELLELNESGFEKALYGYILFQKGSEDLRKVGSFALPRAVLLAENRRYKEACATLDACNSENENFRFLFAQGWLRAKSLDTKGALESFHAIAKGAFEPAQKEIANQSSQIVQDQLLSKVRALAEAHSGLASLGVQTPKEFFAEITYSPSEKIQNKILFLLNTEENRLELALFKNGKLWWQLFSSRVETKIYTDKNPVICRIDGQPFMPTIHQIPEMKIDGDDWSKLYTALGAVDWNNSQKIPAITTLKTIVEGLTVQSPELFEAALKWLDKESYYFEAKTKDSITFSAALVKPDFDKGSLLRYGFEKTNGKISAAQFGSIRLDRFDYSEKGFGDLVSKHLPNVKIVKADDYDQIFQFISLIQLFAQ